MNDSESNDSISYLAEPNTEPTESNTDPTEPNTEPSEPNTEPTDLEESVDSNVNFSKITEIQKKEEMETIKIYFRITNQPLND